MEKYGFFEDDKGNKSSTRLQMFLTMLFTFGVVGWQVYTQSIDIVLTVILFTAAFAPKQIQNFAEKTKIN